jgi:hypothetical protein
MKPEEMSFEERERWQAWAKEVMSSPEGISLCQAAADALHRLDAFYHAHGLCMKMTTTNDENAERKHHMSRLVFIFKLGDDFRPKTN